MEALIMNAAIPSPARFPNCGLPATNKLRSSKVVAICCLRKNGEENRMFDSPLNAGLENQGDGDSSEGTFQPSNFEVEAKQTDIWRLFKEAQQNILYLNKQRIKALEELDRANRENQLLLDRIDQLEVKNQGGDGRGNAVVTKSGSRLS
ncbi:hypothetical protein SAY86_013662 [Trapa natans]|uniref:Uncharacterized protein n=1 Tax=Trapa natans TaxID=22666 RepID=A0AAN7QLY8_TRANT|nr:hypothetical protein SAY86_013662 [Trapa natans]